MAQHIKDGPLVVVHLAVNAYQHQLTITHTKCGDKVQVAATEDVAKVVLKAAQAVASAA